MAVRWGVEPSWKLWLGAWLWVLMVGAGLQLYILPATPWHAGHGLLAGGDWVMFQDLALKLAEKVRQQGWSAWALRYEGQAPASLAAALYVLTGVGEPWVLLPVHGILYALALWAAVSMARTLGIGRRALWLVVLPFAFPSTVLIYGQIHKDILSLPGVMLVAWAWVQAVVRDRVANLASISLAATAGILLCWWARPYQAQLLVGVAGLLWLWTMGLAWRRRRRDLAVVATAVFLTLVAAYVAAEKAAPAAPAAPLCDTWKPEVRLPGFDRPVAAMFCYRHGFIRYLQGKGNIDTDRLLTNYREALAYLPRALQVGLFAPFPVHWLAPASSPGGAVKRALSSVEMLYFYAVMAAGLVTLLIRRPKAEEMMLLVISVAGILLYVYTSPNIGAIYRYRWPFMLLLVVVAVAVWCRHPAFQAKRGR